ncbi:putative beta-catenin-like protein 1 [Gregarina niphandrodes]|uniref:Beta-catenin-like protein 1 n=1 Tax=Gregarina niphandrodes TaxID=110365 RepID=A0A023B1I9_GRENI|nr:putative beta-catenin-like protein 1 [Gregarina niphandrodes]EZG46100.1 putative beta-catenin-like protein 1 [Gregarina niphandrodes]|eukprot:XP_011132356.1 putative beta-catenin-like protein 1 [Gregarina niphandrodes]
MSGRDVVFSNEGSLQKRLAGLERAIERNTSAREKWSHEPKRFLESEMLLDDAVRLFGELSAHPDLILALPRLNGLETLLGLMAHPNPDVCQTVVGVLTELLDVELMPDAAQKAALLEMIEYALTEYALFSLLAEHLDHLDEQDNEEDYEAVTDCLEFVNNLFEATPRLVIRNLAESEQKTLKFLFNRLTYDRVDSNGVFAVSIVCDILTYCSNLVAEETPPTVTSNDVKKSEGVKKFNDVESETLSLLLSIVDNHHAARGMERMLVALSYGKKNNEYETVEAEEMLKSVAVGLNACLSTGRSEVGAVFEECQGTQLLMRLFRVESKLYPLALQLLPVALRISPANCSIFIDRGGLKCLFPIMTGQTKLYKANSIPRLKEIDNCISILYALVFSTSGDSNTRVLTKIVENGMEKFKQLLLILTELYAQMNTLDTELCSQMQYEHKVDWDTTLSESIDQETKPGYHSAVASGLLTQEDLVVEFSLHDEKSNIELGGMFSAILDIVRIVIKLSNMGHKTLGYAVHYTVNYNPEISKIIHAVIKENDFFRGGEERNQYIQFKKRHEAMVASASAHLSEATDRIAKAAEEQREQEKGKIAKSQTEKNRAKSQTEKNRDTRQRHKIRRLDAEAKRLQAIEESRYDQKR